MSDKTKEPAHWLKPPLMPDSPTDDDLFKMTRWAVETGWSINAEHAKRLLDRHDKLEAELAATRTALSTLEGEKAELQESVSLLRGFLERAHWHGWVCRERLTGPDAGPIEYPAGLDYEQQQEYAFQEWYHLAAIDLIVPPAPACSTSCPTPCMGKKGGKS